MQTFLPYSDFSECARVLDIRRLGKQRVEALQILIALTEKRGWIHHPAVKMWEGYPKALLAYQFSLCHQWAEVYKYDDTCLEKSLALYIHWFGDPGNIQDYVEPFWLGDEEFHLSHQSNLIRKDPTYYRLIFPNVPDDLPYVWPVIT